MCHQVDLLKRFQRVAMKENIQQSDDVFMIHVLQQSQLAKSSLCMNCRLKWSIQFFDSHLASTDGVICGAKIKEREKSLFSDISLMIINHHQC
jgi:hypothetical protein